MAADAPVSGFDPASGLLDAARTSVEYLEAGGSGRRFEIASILRDLIAELEKRSTALDEIERLRDALQPFLAANPHFITIGRWEGVELRVELSRWREAKNFMPTYGKQTVSKGGGG